MFQAGIYQRPTVFQTVISSLSAGLGQLGLKSSKMDTLRTTRSTTAEDQEAQTLRPHSLEMGPMCSRACGSFEPKAAWPSPGNLLCMGQSPGTAGPSCSIRDLEISTQLYSAQREN